MKSLMSPKSVVLVQSHCAAVGKKFTAVTAVNQHFAVEKM